MKLLIKQFRTWGGRYRMVRAIFDCPRDNTKQHSGRRKSYLAVLQGKNYKFRAGYVGMKICWRAVREDEVDIR